MRIISGYLKGMRIKNLKGFHSRPTTDFAKEGLFNVLEHGYELENIKVLDAFAGTGNISYEFISRGSSSVYSVESHHKAIKFIKETSKELNISAEQHQIIKADVHKFLLKTEATFDIIFADPPFDYSDYSMITSVSKSRKLLNLSGILIIEHYKKIDLSHLEGFQKSQAFGNVYFSFFNFEVDEK